MRKFITILCLIISFFGFSQNPTGPIAPLPNWNYVGSRTTLTEVRGVLNPRYGIILSRWIDTTAANADPYIKFYAGMQIVIGDTVWFRNSTATAWLKGSGGSGGGGSSTWGSITGTLSSQTDLQTALNLKANLASPTFTGVVTMPTPYTLGATSVTSNGTQLNYLNAATGTTGTASTNIVFSTSPLFVTPRLNSTSTTGYLWTATDGSGNGSFQINNSYDAIRLISSNTVAFERVSGTEDTLVIANLAYIDTIYRVVGNDSIFYTKSGVTYSFKDSTSAGTSYIWGTGLTNAANTITANLSTGVAFGQSVIGGTASGDDLTLSSTSNATKGDVIFGTSRYDEVNNRLGIRGTPGAYAVDIWNGNHGNILLGGDADVNTRTNSINKFGGIAGVHYTNAEEPLSIFRYGITSTASIITIGQGVNPGYNSSTSVDIYTAANNTTLVGTRKLTFTNTKALFNDPGANFDFQISGDNDANAFWVDASSDFVGVGIAVPTSKLTVVGNIEMNTAGNKLKIATGSNASIGTSTLVSGTVTVSTTAVVTGSKIFVSLNTPSGTLALSYATPDASITNATSFVINAVDAAGAVLTTDNSTINWWIIN